MFGNSSGGAQSGGSANGGSSSGGFSNGGSSSGGSSSGGFSNGGALFGTGGSNSGGAMGAGGQGRGGAGSGGNGSGGTASGGSGSGGRASGGNGSGGAASGGAASGGAPMGGAPMGGAPMGGAPMGGAPMGGAPPARGGAPGSGGYLGMGGTLGMGGLLGMGGASIPSNCTEADKSFTANAIGQHCGYTYEYWKDSGTGTLTVKPDGFSVTWNQIGNLLGRKGIRPGSANLVVTYEANYQPSGNSYLTIYGWTRNPLVEYYIVDSWGSWRPPGASSVGTVSSDGGVYDIYKTQRVNQPSIDGTQTFNQYWSVRQSKRTSGTITVANHFNAWATKSMPMGSFYEVSMTVEGYQSSGTADVKMSIK
jgi:endo-1,4-beta-xylanase